MYLMLGTRPDLAYAVRALGCHTANPSPDHQRTLEHVYHYLCATHDYQLFYQCRSNSGTTLHGFMDADWGSNLNDHKSTSGYAFMLAGGAIS
jgi:hypothetical protein